MKNFSWGKVVDRHSIGPYELIEYHPRVVEGSRVTNRIDETKTEFHGIIDGCDVHESWKTLDEALAGLIVRRALGPNSRDINYHFMAGIRALAPTPTT